MLRTPLRALLAVTLLPTFLSAQDGAVRRAAATITEADYARRIGVIAHDSMMGRNTPSPELDETAEWLASELRAMGLRGGTADGGFIQRYPLEETSLDTAASRLEGEGIRLSYGGDVLPLFGGGGEVEGVRGRLVLFSGSASPAAALSSPLLKGSHVVVVGPPGPVRRSQTLFQLMAGLQRAGAASILVADGSEDERWTATAARVLRPSVRKTWGEDEDGDESSSALLQVRDGALERLLAGRGIDLGALRARSGQVARVEQVRGVQLSLTQRIRVRDTSAPNVVAILDGSDPELRGEYVVFSGHMDHVGVGTPDERGDSIFNGADDDASGTIAVVEVAQAMAALPTPPRRSMMFLLVSGEEKGLWGSEFFAQNPSVPVEALVADLNTDMVGRNWPDTIVAIGREHSDLGETLERVNEAHPELGMTAIDDLWPEERFYFRSDHYNFARNGVPILFFFNGTHEDYHGRDDEPDRIDAEKAARIAQLVFYLGVEIGNADERPRWNPESYRRIVTGGR